MSNKKGFGKFVLGAGVGAGLALLFAPQDGRATRKELKIKLEELVDKVKEIDANEVKDNILDKVEDLKSEIATLDKEKALDIAKNQAKKVGKKAEELYDYAKEKGTPIVEKAVKEVKNATLNVAKDVVNKLEEEDKPKQSSKKNTKSK